MIKKNPQTSKKIPKSLSSPQKIPNILNVYEYLGKEDNVSTVKLSSQSIHI